jgi:tetratricopeptide (TPR) repeat protein
MVRVQLSAAVAAAAIVVVGSAGAQVTQPVAEITLTPAERGALLPLKQAVDARNWTLATSLAPAARAAARSENARYVAARLQLETAIATQNRTAQNEAIGAVLDSRRAGPQEQVELLRQYASLAYDAGNMGAAERALNRALGIAPEDAEILSMLGQINRSQNKTTQALGFFQRAVRATAVSGRPLPESRYKAALALAEQAGQRGVALEIARSFIAAYPRPGNWRDVLMVFRTVGTVDAGQQLDAMRLMRSAGALAGERDYLGLATALDQAGFPAEAKAVIDEGVTRRHVTASDAAVRALITSTTPRIARERAGLTALLTQARAPTATATQARNAADILYSHGRYAEAAELYNLASTRVGEDPEVLNTRQGMAMAMAGRRSEAGAAFSLATGSRSDLAALWSTWLTSRPS